MGKIRKVIVEPSCLKCKNLIRYPFCMAFPMADGIPADVRAGENNHTEPIKGDGGFLLDPFVKPNESSTKHLPGEHDQLSHGNWADGQAVLPGYEGLDPKMPEYDDPFEKLPLGFSEGRFKTKAEADQWLKDNESWGGINFSYVTYGISDEDYIEIVETFAAMKDLGVPGIKGFRGYVPYADWISVHEDRTGRFLTRSGLIEVGIDSLAHVDAMQIDMLERYLAGSPGVSVSEEVSIQALHEKLDALKTGKGLERSHSLRYFPEHRNIEAMMRHEFGHYVHEFPDFQPRLDRLKTKVYKWNGGVTHRANDGWYECVAENFSLWSIGETENMHPLMVKEFDDIFYGLKDAGKKHLRGQHDQSSHGNWARGIRKRKFTSKKVAEKWLKDNEDWTGGVFWFSDLFYMSDEDYLEVVETLADLKDFGVPSIQEYRKEKDFAKGKRIIIDPTLESGGSFKISNGSIKINPNSLGLQEKRQIEALERFTVSDEFDLYKEKPRKEWLNKLKALKSGIGRKEHHSKYYLPDERNIEATIRHEFGHFVHFDNKQKTRYRGSFEEIMTWDWDKKYGVTKRSRDNWVECIAENFVLYSVGETDVMHPDMVAKFDEVFGRETKSSVKHLRGQHDQSSHGNWARGISKRADRPDVKFYHGEDALLWLEENEWWTGGVMFMGDISEFDTIEIVETLAELKALGLPSIAVHGEQEARQFPRYIIDADNEVSRYEAHGLIFISGMDRYRFEYYQINEIDKMIAKSDPTDAAILKYRKNVLLHGDKKRAHSMYYFERERNLEATLRHEYGHFFHEWHQEWGGGRPSKPQHNIDDLLSGENWKNDFGITERAKDNRNECVAENFVLWSIGETDKMKPEMVSAFDDLLEWNRNLFSAIGEYE